MMLLGIICLALIAIALLPVALVAAYSGFMLLLSKCSNASG